MIIEVDAEAKTVKIDGNLVYPYIRRKTIDDLLYEHNGVKEYSGIVATIQRWYYGYVSETAWCATCISYFAAVAGLTDQIGKHENVDLMKEYMNKKNELDCTKNYGGGAYSPKKGDIVFMSNKFNYEDCTHVGVVRSVDNNTGDINIISGNYQDGIGIQKTNYRTNKYIVAFGCVSYA